METKKKGFSRPRPYPQDTLYATGYKSQKLYCDCSKCLSASTAKKHGKGGAGKR